LAESEIRVQGIQNTWISMTGYCGNCFFAAPTNKLKKTLKSISARKLRKLAELGVKVYRKSGVVPMMIRPRDEMQLRTRKTSSCLRTGRPRIMTRRKK